MSILGLQPSTSYPTRGAVGVLSDQLISYLKASKKEVGTKLATDADLAAQTNLSHSTVRRALRQLQKDGWIERRVGHGSFVGPRAALGFSGAAADQPIASRAPATVRLGVVAHFGRSDWYVAGVLEALDRLAGEHGFAVELFNAWNMANAGETARRFERSRPDVIAMITPRLPQAAIAAEVQRLGIPLVATGTALMEMGVPVICEDGVTGASMAVAHLVERGHKRIGFLGISVAERFMFMRRAGWQKGLADAGIEHDEGLVCWLAPDVPAPEWMAHLDNYLKREKPTALVVATTTCMEHLGDYATATGLRVPEDLSVVTFDQSFEVYRAHFGSTFTPTVVAIPLSDIAETIARYTLKPGEMPAKAELACSLVHGRSVATL